MSSEGADDLSYPGTESLPSGLPLLQPTVTRRVQQCELLPSNDWPRSLPWWRPQPCWSGLPRSNHPSRRRPNRPAPLLRQWKNTSLHPRSCSAGGRRTKRDGCTRRGSRRTGSPTTPASGIAMTCAAAPGSSSWSQSKPSARSASRRSTTPNWPPPCPRQQVPSTGPTASPSTRLLSLTTARLSPSASRARPGSAT
jgi:hypothetical protein